MVMEVWRRTGKLGSEDGGRIVRAVGIVCVWECREDVRMRRYGSGEKGVNGCDRVASGNGNGGDEHFWRWVRMVV